MSAGTLALVVITSAATTLVTWLLIHPQYWRALLPIPRPKPLDPEVLGRIMASAQGVVTQQPHSDPESAHPHPGHQ